MNSATGNRTMAFLRIIRAENLLMIALTQVLLHYFVLRKVLYMHQIQPELSGGLFFLVVLSTVLIAAAGYIINDYFDVKTDTINHPDTVVVDRIVSRRTAIILHIVLTFLGIATGMFAALKTGYLRLAIFHFAAATLLWFYSTDLKRKLLTGNITVAVLTAAVTFMPFVFEMGVMQRVTPGFFDSYRHAVLSSLKYAWIFSIFAFITTLAREIIKDMEDYEGDAATGCRTLPIVYGFNAGKVTTFFLLVITGILLLFVVYNSIRFERVVVTFSNAYILLALVLPLCLLAVYTLRARESVEFGKASRWLKLIMLMGLLYSLVFYFR